MWKMDKHFVLIQFHFYDRLYLNGIINHGKLYTLPPKQKGDLQSIVLFG